METERDFAIQSRIVGILFLIKAFLSWCYVDVTGLVLGKF